MSIVNKGIIFAIIAAICYGISSPFSKLLLDYISPMFMAGFLYLGAGLCMGIFYIINLIKHAKITLNFKKHDLIYIILMILLDVIAPILLMEGLRLTSASNASLLNNFEIVMTSLIAFIIYKEKISPRLLTGILIITLSCMILSIEGADAFKFSIGSLFILLAATCWGFENNCTRVISHLDPKFTVLLKGTFSGLISIILAIIFKEKITYIFPIFASLGLGVIAYGLSIFFYIYAQRYIGAAKTSSYYALAPFIGTFLSFLLLNETFNISYLVALIMMVLGTYYVTNEYPFNNLITKYILLRN